MIREALSIGPYRLTDLPSAAKLEMNSYGERGMSARDLKERLTSSPAELLIMERTGSMIGFVLVEMVEPGRVPDGFSDLKISAPFTDKWMHISAFTTESNFSDVETDSQLVAAAESLARDLKCNTICVPLNVRHRYDKPPHNVFQFFERNGYKHVGEIIWNGPSGNEPCRFYRKDLISQ